MHCRDEYNSRDDIQERIRYYFNQLTIGCGNPDCENQNCASSARFIHEGIDNNHAAAVALGLLRESGPTCFCNSTSSAATNSEANQQQRPSDDDEVSRPCSTVAGDTEAQHQHVSVSDNRSPVDEEMFPSGSHSDGIASGLSRFLLQVSSSPPPVESSQSIAVGASSPDSDRARFSRILGLIDRFVKDNTDIDQREEGSLLGGEDDNDTTATAPPVVSKRVEGLTISELRSCIASCKFSGEWMPLKNLLDDVMMSLTAMANSFSSVSTHATAVDDAVSSRCPIDVEMKPLEGEEPSTSRSRRRGFSSPRPPVFLNAACESASAVDIEAAREAFRLMLEEPPQEAGILQLVSQHLHRLLVVPLRAILLKPALNAALSGGGMPSPTDPTYELLAQAKVQPGSPADDTQQRMVNVFAIIYACPLVTDPLYFERLLTHLCRLTSSLPLASQGRLCRLWANHASVQRATSSSSSGDSESFWLLDLHRILMQQITLRCLTIEPSQSLSGGSDSAEETKPAPNDDRCIREAAQVIRLVFFASLLAGQRDPPEQLAREMIENVQLSSFPTTGTSAVAQSSAAERTALKREPLADLLGIRPIDCRSPIIPASEFINETLNDAIVVEKDFVYFRSQPLSWPEKLSFMNLPFMLQTTIKSTQLYYDNRLHMLQERRGALLHSILSATTGSDAATLEMPFFKICVARERVVEDALIVLEITRQEAIGDFKKQLYVEFDGEQGLDEGGLSKEFFQLIIQRIFNPDYGMFTFDEDTQCFWFNRTPLGEELDREYCLIGTILGLAIYNNIILDVRFPSVLYRKLAGKLASGIDDLKDGWPHLARGFQSLLDYDGDTFEEDHCLTFVATYTDMFGQVVVQELVPGGESMSVTIENRQEYINRTIDFLLNTSVQSQFFAFRKGFLSVVDDTLLFNLFTPPEIELLLRGSQEYDFSELERVTEYNSDYCAETPVIRQFWAVVHALSETDQRRLLQFTTGTDRIPIGGMSHMKFVIARQGPDSDRLPTAHTCFNVLLLPEYSSQEKLETCLRTAIAYSKGFGMF